MRIATHAVCRAAALCLLAGATLHAAVQSSFKDGTLQLKSGPVTVTAAGENVAVQTGNLAIAGKGALYVLTPQDNGPATAAALKPAADVKLPDAGFVVVAVPLFQGSGAAALAVLNIGNAPAACRFAPPAVGLPGSVFATFSPAANEFAGPYFDTVSLRVQGNDAQLLAIAAAGERPVLFCTAATFAPGGEAAPPVTWDPATGTLSGTALVPAGVTELRFLAPPEPTRWVAESATAGEGVRLHLMQTRPWLRLYLEADEAKAATPWQIKFAAKPAGTLAAGEAKLTAEAASARRAILFSSAVGSDLMIRRDDGVVIPVNGGRADDDNAVPGATHTYTLLPLTWTGDAKVLAEAKVTMPELPPLPPLPNVYLSDIKPLKSVTGWNDYVRNDLSIEDNPITIRGEVYKKGLGTHAVSEIVYKIRPQYLRFVAVAGVDDEKNDSPSGSVTFSVYADDNRLYESKVLTPYDEREAINVEIPKGAKELRLLVGDGGNSVGCDHADWANAGFVTDGTPLPVETFEAEPGFNMLFDGKTLDGWDGDPRLWSVRDGILCGETTPENPTQGNTFLIYRGAVLKNFILKLKFRIAGGNSGVQYRAKEIGKWRIGGYQAEVENTPGKVGFLYDEAARGWLVNVGDSMVIDENGEKKVVGKVADKDELIRQGYYKDKDWNEYTIIARGNHILHMLNGFPTMELIDRDPKGAREGVLALQIHAGPPMLVEFTDIRMKALTDNYGDAIRLFDGETLNGWTLSSDACKDTFGVKDGAITNTGNPAGYLRTEKDYTNYTLHLQMRHLSSGNSGVLVRMVGPDKVWPRSIEAQGMTRNMGDIWNIDKFPLDAGAERTRDRHTPKLHPSNENPLGEWNRYRITLDGGDLEIAVNGLVQNTAKDCWETPGKVCLQSEGAQTEWRNVVLIPIERPAKDN